MENLTVKVYGSGCKGCQTLHQNVIDALAEMNLVVNVEYITDLQKVMEAGIMSMPTLSVNEKVVSSGKILGIPEIKKIIEAEQ
jgi:redox-active disulfide protein 2